MVESTEKEDLQVFSADRWIKLAQKLADSPNNLEVEPFVAFLYETTNLFKKMGSAMSMAFSGIH